MKKTKIRKIMSGAEQILTQSNADKCDRVYFGNYPQNRISEISNIRNKVKRIKGKDGNTYSIDPIAWRVLSNNLNDDGSLFLLSDKNLDVVKYHEEFIDITWEKSTIRSWLNAYKETAEYENNDFSEDNFKDFAFSEKEKNAIVITAVKTGENSDFPNAEQDGKAVSDQIFLLSVNEVISEEYGFRTKSKYDHNATENRKARNTEYVENRCGKTGYSPTNDEGFGVWWLRSPGYIPNFSAFIDSDGSVGSDGDCVNYYLIAVRPAFNLDLNSVLFTSAAKDGKLSDEGVLEIKEIPEYALFRVANDSYTQEIYRSWKVTLRDKSRDTFKVTKAQRMENALTIEYEGAIVPKNRHKKNEYISVILADKVTGEFTHYGRVKQLEPEEFDRSGKVTIDFSGLVNSSDEIFDMNKKTLYVFNEQCNDDYRTDYASALIPVDGAEENIVSGETKKDSEMKRKYFDVKI